MHTAIPTPVTTTHSRSPIVKDLFRDPHYECVQMGAGMKIEVYIPGVDAGGVEISLRGTDLVITARKTRIVRVNWRALHLEGAQLDYQLRLRVGHRFDALALSAELTDGVLTVMLPKRLQETDTSVLVHRKVA